MSSYFVRTLSVVMAFALAALVVAVSFGAAWGWGVFCTALAGLLAYHVRHLDLLRNWASGTLHESVPEGSGIWSEVFTLLYRRQRAEARQRMRLARMLARSRQAGRALPYGLAILDADYRIDWCNDSSEAHFEIDFEKDAGQPITNLVRQPEFVEYVSAKHFSKPLEMKSARVNGPVLSVQLVPYVELRWLLISRDITEAAKLQVMRRDFVANVSHELRTPLTVLVGFLETMRESRHDPQRSREYLDLMAEQGRRMQRIIDDLLALSTLQSAPEPPRDERVDVHRLLERTRVEAEALSGGRHRVTLEADTGFDLLGSESELASAFSNLVSNAVRYTLPGGEIRLIWRASPKDAEFAVEDTGMGIEQEHIPRLTERFYRADRGRSRESGGTGLGLAIAKHALARHQASLDIISEVDKGSRFAARFPARRLAPVRFGSETLKVRATDEA